MLVVAVGAMGGLDFLLVDFTGGFSNPDVHSKLAVGGRFFDF